MEEIISIKTSNKVFCSIMSVIAIFFYQLLFGVIPEFAETFENFGADLPVITQAFIMFRWPLGALCLASIFPFSTWIDNHFIKSNYQSIYKASVINAVVSFLLLPTCMYAMYYPAFSLGAS